MFKTLIVCLSLFFCACSADPLDRAASALGGAEALKASLGQSWNAAGKRFDRYEAFALSGDHGVEQFAYTSKIDLDFAARAQHGEWSGTTSYVFPGSMGAW